MFELVACDGATIESEQASHTPKQRAKSCEILGRRLHQASLLAQVSRKLGELIQKTQLELGLLRVGAKLLQEGTVFEVVSEQAACLTDDAEGKVCILRTGRLQLVLLLASLS